MSEIETALLGKFKAELASQVGIPAELVKSVSEELAKDSPNAEKLAEAIKKQPKAEL